MKNYHSTARACLALMIGTLLLAFAACKKSPESIGNNLISDSNFIVPFYTDTTEILCYSYFDSVSTKNTNNVLLGSMKGMPDPFNAAVAHAAVRLRRQQREERRGLPQRRVRGQRRRQGKRRRGLDL